MGIVHSSALSVDYKLSEGDDIQVVKWIIQESNDEVELTLDDLVAKGYAFSQHVEKYPADAVFIEKEISFVFNVKKEFQNLRLVGTTELDSEVFSQLSLGIALELPEGIMTHEVPISKLPVGNEVSLKHKLYVSRDFSQRVVSLFLITKEKVIKIMARCLIVQNEELGKFDQSLGAAETIAERESRIKRLVSELSDKTFFRIYSEDHLARAIMLAQSVILPPVEFWVSTKVGGANATKSSFLGLAYRYYKARSPPIVTLILIATDSYFTSPLAWQLSQHSAIDVYVCHPRGFGPSEGIRGYSETSTSIWEDISTFVEMIKASARIRNPIFLAGHFWGASMCIKYSLWTKKKIDGLVLISPSLGKRLMRKNFLETARRNKTAEVHISTVRIILWRFSGGHFGGRKTVLKLQSDPLLKEFDSSMVDSVSLNTLCSWMFTDTKPKHLSIPSLVIFGDQDEFFEPKSALALFPEAKKVELEGEDSLTSIGASTQSVADWLIIEAQKHNLESHEHKKEMVTECFGLFKEKEEPNINGIVINCGSNTLSLNITTYKCDCVRPQTIALSLKHLALNNPGRRLILAFDGKLDSDMEKLVQGIVTTNPKCDFVCWSPDDPNLQEKIETFCKRTTDFQEGPEPLNHDFNISAYETLELIGKGSFGTVWLARALTTGKPVAIKQIPKTTLNIAGQLDAIKSELSILNKVRSNPHTVTLLNYGQDVSNIYFVLEYVIGGELFTRMKRLRGRMTEKDARFYIAELAVALHSLHESGIVYRDLKPENVLISASGHIKLTDFGFAATLNYGEKLDSFCGSPYYIAPEMLISSTYDSSIDWWALGILAYELLVGQPPFIGKNPREVYRAILVGNTDWSPLESYPEAQQLIKGFLRCDPLKRYRYAEVQQSQWFQGTDWRRVESRGLESPHVINVASPFDASNFVKFPNDEAQFGPNVTTRESVHVSEFSAKK